MAKKKGFSRATLDSLLLGSNAGAAKQKGTARQYKLLQKAAAKRGVTLDSFLSGNPAPLQERTRPSLVNQAKNTMSTVYKPAETDLSRQEGRINAIDAKRKRDNQYYLTWLDQQQQKLATDAHAADVLLHDHQVQVQAATNDAIDKAHTESQANAAATAGNVSDPSQSNALNEATSNERLRFNPLFAAEVTNQDEQSHGNAKQIALAGANNTAFMAAQEAKRVAETWGKLADVGDERTKLRLGKAADTAKEIARLLDGEVDKANSNRDFKALLDKLQVTERGQNITAANNRSVARNRNAKLDAAQHAQRYAEMKGDREYQLNLKKFGADQAKTLWQQKHPKASEQKAAADLKFFKKHGYYPSTGPPKNGPGAAGDFTPTQVRAGKTTLRKVQDAVKIEGAGITKEDLTDPLGDYKFDPMMADAVLGMKKNGGFASPAFAKKFFAAYGFHLPTRGK